MEDRMNQLMRFEDLREWLVSKVNDSVEIVGEDELILGFIRKLDAAPSATAWCVAYDDPRMGRIHSDPTMHRPQAEELAARRGLALVPLYAAPVEVAEPVDHGYDRSASLNAGQYVCTCAAIREGAA
jgi:hypothetical protein